MIVGVSTPSKSNSAALYCATERKPLLGAIGHHPFTAPARAPGAKYFCKEQEHDCLQS
jgi:hypothetical protein